MSNARNVLTTIHSTQKTEKITHAMELVSVSKLNRAQQTMATSRPYSEKIRQVIDHIGKSSSEYRHPFLTRSKTTKRIGLIIIATDRGLCGSLNINLFKLVLEKINKWSEKNIACDVCLIGRKAELFFHRLSTNIIASTTQLGEKPTVLETVGVVKVMIDAYLSGQVDHVMLAHNHFINVMSQEPRLDEILPIKTDNQAEKHWDYLYEPEAKEVLDCLLKRYIESQVHQGVIENIACEHAARMVSMKNATENANDIIDDLQLLYNKARQASITQELAEIVAGAEAV